MGSFWDLAVPIDPVTAYEQPLANFCRYCYAKNNPYKFMDPDGRQSFPKPAHFNVSGADVVQEMFPTLKAEMALPLSVLA